MRRLVPEWTDKGSQKFRRIEIEDLKHVAALIRQISPFKFQGCGAIPSCVPSEAVQSPCCLGTLQDDEEFF